MSKYEQSELNSGVITGFADDNIKAWHQAGIDLNDLIVMGRAYHQGIPADVAERLIGWAPIVVTPEYITNVIGDTTDDIAVGMYELPQHLSKFIINPYTMRVVNIVGDGYNPTLHIEMQNAIQAAMDAECDIASVVCLGDGAHMGMSFRARDGVEIGGEFGGAIPLVGFNSSLTGAIASQIDTGTVLRVCDNTMAAAGMSALKKIRRRRTRNSGVTLTASLIREQLDIAFAETETLANELERLANIDITFDQVQMILDTWKPIPDEEGRGKTIAENTRKAFITELHGGRNPFGITVGGMVQAHNTWAHWSQTMRGDGSGVARLERKAVRTMLGDVASDDAKFMDIMIGAGLLGEDVMVGA